MSFSTDFPNISQWVSYHGKMTIAQIDDKTIEVTLADAGGIPDDGRFQGATTDEALAKANQALFGWLESNKGLLNSLLSGELKAPETEEFIRVPGWPPVKNPFYYAA
jgi:hypothetical protein